MKKRAFQNSIHTTEIVIQSELFLLVQQQQRALTRTFKVVLRLPTMESFKRVQCSSFSLKLLQLVSSRQEYCLVCVQQHNPICSCELLCILMKHYSVVDANNVSMPSIYRQLKFIIIIIIKTIVLLWSQLRKETHYVETICMLQQHSIKMYYTNILFMKLLFKESIQITLYYYKNCCN